MGMDKLNQTIEQMHGDCCTFLCRLAELSEEELAKPTPHNWAPTVADLIAMAAQHKLDHAQHIMAKRQALGLELSHVQKALSEVAEGEGKLEAALVGLEDGNLDGKPAGQNWSIGQVLDHIAESDTWFLGEIEKALKS